MTYDKKIGELFLQNFSEAHRSAKLLAMSYKRVAHLIPLTFEDMLALSPDDLDKLDAFRVRFCDLQDALGNKIFRSLLKLEEEEVGSQLDIINKIEKRQIVGSFDQWKELRNIRNLFAHDYPETEAQKAESLNIAYKHTLELIEMLNRVKQYTEKKIKLPMESLELIKENF